MINISEIYKRILKASLASTGSIRQIWKPVWRVLTFSLADDAILPKRCLFISIDMGGVSIAHASRLLSRIKIRGIKRYPVEEGKYPEPENLASTVALAMNDLTARKADIMLSIPKAWTIIRSADFPLTVKENLPEVIAYELDRVTPLSPENAYYDFKTLKEREGQISIAVAAVQVDLIEKYLEALKSRGIHVKGLTLNHSVIGSLLTNLYKKTNYIFIDVGRNTYDVGLIISGAISSVTTGRFDAGDEQGAMEKIIGQIGLLAETLRRQGILFEIVFYSNEIDCTKFAEKMLGAIKVLRDADIKNRFPNESKEPQSVAVGGILEALWTGARGFNLLSRGKREESRPAMMLTMIFLFTVLIIGITYMVAPLQIEGRKIDELEYQIMLRKDEVKKAEALRTERDNLKNDITTIMNFKEKRPMSLAILKEITTILPKTAWLSRIRITESTVDIEGYATSSPADLLSKLDASKYFRKVEFASPTIRDMGMKADRFVIKMEIKDSNNGGEQKPQDDKKK